MSETKSRYQLVLSDVIESAHRSFARYDAYASTHEAYGVLAEESAELLAAIQSNDWEAIRAEALDVAAVAFKLAGDMDHDEDSPERPMRHRSGCR